VLSFVEETIDDSEGEEDGFPATGIEEALEGKVTSSIS
jgi:hypothetical protein